MKLIYYKPGTELYVSRGILEDGHTFEGFLFEGETFSVIVTDNFYSLDENHEDFYVVILKVSCKMTKTPLYLVTRQHKDGLVEDWRCYTELSIALGNEAVSLPSLSGHRRCELFSHEETATAGIFDTETVNVDLRGMNRPENFSLVDFSHCFGTYWTISEVFGHYHTSRRLNFWRYDVASNTMCPYQPIDENPLPHIDEIPYAFADKKGVEDFEIAISKKHIKNFEDAVKEGDKPQSKFDTDAVLRFLDDAKKAIEEAMRELIPEKGELEIVNYTIHQPCPSISSFTITKLRIDKYDNIQVFDHNNGRWYDYSLIVGIEGLCYFYDFVYKSVKND